MLNNVTLMGRLTADPRIATTQNGNKVASFTLACDRDFGEGADFIVCTSWRKGAEFAEKFLHKGLKICVQGRITTSQFTDKDDNKRTKTEVTVEQFHFCEPKQTSAENPERPKYPPSSSTFTDLGDDGELPF